MAKIRLEVTKGEEVRFISHLDYASAMERAVRRASLPAAYSEGFNPHMKLAFASALAVGVTSEAEYMDIELTEDIEPTEVSRRLREVLPPGIVAKRAVQMPERTPALMAIVNLASYMIQVAETASPDLVAQIEASVTAFNAAEAVIYTRHTPKGKREINVKQYMAAPVQVIVLPDAVCISADIHITPTGSIKPSDLVAALIADFSLPAAAATARITRSGLYIQKEGCRRTPLDA